MKRFILVPTLALVAMTACLDRPQQADEAASAPTAPAASASQVAAEGETAGQSSICTAFTRERAEAKKVAESTSATKAAAQKAVEDVASLDALIADACS